MSRRSTASSGRRSRRTTTRSISAGHGGEGLKRIAADAPDVVVLDLGLPDMDGKDVIARVREWSDVPIIVLSARDREAEKIAALDLGADDFVNKPFGMGELMARLRTALRHRMQRKGETPVVSVGGLEIDVPRRRVTWQGSEVNSQPEGVRPSRLPGEPRRQGGDAQADPHRRLGRGPRERHPIPAGLCRPAPAEDRAEPVRSRASS